MKVTLVRNLDDLLAPENHKKGVAIENLSYLPDWYRLKVNIGAGSIYYETSKKASEIEATLLEIAKTGVEIKEIYLCFVSPPQGSSKLVGDLR